MNGALLRHTWRVQRTKLAIVSIALAVWGFLLAVVYARFGSQFTARDAERAAAGAVRPLRRRRCVQPRRFDRPRLDPSDRDHSDVGVRGGVFSRRPSPASGSGARSKSRWRGRCPGECSISACSRPRSDSSPSAIAALLAGSVSGATFAGVVEELAFRNLPLLWLNSVLLFGAFAAIALAASVSFDRLTPALGVTLGIVIAMYVLEVLGSLWPAAEPLQPYSLFHYLKAKAILTGVVAPFDLVVLSSVILIAMVWALVVFPRRDLAAPAPARVGQPPSRFRCPHERRWRREADPPTRPRSIRAASTTTTR